MDNYKDPTKPDWASIKIWAQEMADKALLLHWEGISPQYQIDTLITAHRRIIAELKKLEDNSAVS